MECHQLSLRRIWAALFVCFFASSLAVFGQGNFGAITGAVYDTSGAVVPGADVTILNLETGLELNTETTSAGNYLMPNLPVGRYSVTVAAESFKTFQRQPVFVSTATTVTVNATLEVGAVTETISVEATAVQLDSSTSDIGTVMNEDVFRKVPYDIAGMNQQSGIRQPQQFILMVPGVTGNAGTHRINGGQRNSQTLQVDGHNWQLLNRPGRMNSWPPPFEAIEEFKLQTAQYGAEAAVGTAVTQFTMKSGSDEFHGTASHLMRNQSLNARGFFAPIRPPLKLNESVITVGGPIVKTKTHFFFNLTRYSRRGGASAASIITVPTPEFKQGNFGAWDGPIFDPATTRDDGAGGFERDPFANNIIPSSRIGPVGRNGAGLMVNPTSPGVLRNHTIIASNNENLWLWNTKVDHAWSPNQITRFTFFLQNRDRVRPRGYDDGVLDPGDATVANNKNFLVSHTSVISPRIVNEARWSLAPWIGPQKNVGISDADGTAALGIPNHPSAAGITPRLAFSGTGSLFSPLGNSGRQPFNSIRKNFAWGDTLSWVTGAHNLKFGGTGIYSMDDTQRHLNELGIFTFSNRSTSQPNASNVGSLGHSFATFLLGDVFSANRLLPFGFDRERVRRFEMFFQDDWKVSRKLTLNLGINYHIPFTWIDGEDRLSFMDPNLPNPGADGIPGALAFVGEGSGRTGQRNIADNYYKAWAPRLGLAYQINEKTVFRGGIGIFYGYAPSHHTFNGSPREGFTFVQDVRSLDQGITPAFNVNNGFPSINLNLPNLDPALKNGSTAVFVHPDSNRPPLSTNWSLGVQRELPWHLMLDVAYVANRSSRLPSRLENINQLHPDLLGMGSLLNQNINSTAAQEAGIAKPFESFSGTVRQALRPFPQYTNVQNRFQGTGYSNYQSLQVKFERRFATGLFFLNAYTFSKLIDTGGAGNGAGNPIALDTFNRNLEKALADDDQTHTWVSSLVYDLPFGPGQRWLNNRVLGNILGNWRFGASLRYYSGVPLRLTSGQSLPLFGGTNRPHQVSGVAMQNFSGSFDPASDLYLNPDAFEDPAPFTFGTVGRTLPNLRAPSFLNENFTLAKVISFAEDKEVEIYAIYLNAFNRVVFRGPTTNVSSRNFGRITGQSNDPRQVEMGLRLRW